MRIDDDHPDPQGRQAKKITSKEGNRHANRESFVGLYRLSCRLTIVGFAFLF
jgi:hypothetical protein